MGARHRVEDSLFLHVVLLNEHQQGVAVVEKGVELAAGCRVGHLVEHTAHFRVLRAHDGGRPRAVHVHRVFESREEDLFLHVEMAAHRLVVLTPQFLGARPVTRRDRIRDLDIAPLLAQDVDASATIHFAIESLGRGGVLKISAAARPDEILETLRRNGHTATDRRMAPHRWAVEVVVGGAPPIEDLRDLEPPEPLVRILKATVDMPSGAVFLARLPHYPRPLIPHLEARRLRWSIYEEPDGTALLRVWRNR